MLWLSEGFCKILLAEMPAFVNDMKSGGIWQGSHGMGKRSILGELDRRPEATSYPRVNDAFGECIPTCSRVRRIL